MRVGHTLRYRALRWAAVAGLLSLALMVWGLFDPQPISLIIAMSVGQVLGTGAFAVYLLVVFLDLREAGIFGGSRRSPEPTPPPQDTD